MKMNSRIPLITSERKRTERDDEGAIGAYYFEVMRCVLWFGVQRFLQSPQLVVSFLLRDRDAFLWSEDDEENAEDGAPGREQRGEGQGFESERPPPWCQR